MIWHVPHGRRCKRENVATRTINPRHVQRTFTVPASTLAAAPLIQALDLGHTVLNKIELLIPAGHGVQTGIALTLAGQAILPFDQPLRYITGDGQSFTFPIGIEIDSGFRMQGINLDVFPHTFYLTFELDDLALQEQASTGLIVPVSFGG